MKIRKLRPDQKKAIKACGKHSLGRLVAPTGCGKTVIALSAVHEIAKRHKKDKKPFVAVSFVHRILLAKQWIKNTSSFLIEQHQIPFNFVNINSGGLSSKIRKDIEEAMYGLDGAGVIPVLATTSPAEVNKRVTNLLDKGFNVFISCTYHSADVLVQADLPIAIAIYDECQTLPNNPEFRRCLDLQADKKLFFTATPCTTAAEDGWGHNNVSKYGEIIFEMKPIEAMKIGAIVGPQIHVVGTEWEEGQLNDGELENRDFNTLTDLVFYSFAKHKEQVKKQSADPDKIGAKLLVVCNGQLELQGIFASRRFQEHRRDNPNIQIFGLSSDFGIYMNGEQNDPPVSTALKEEFLYALDPEHLGVETDAIIFHVDMIAEGLDVPSITGMLPLRNFSTTMKFLQNVGRATRLHPIDMERIENGTLEPGKWSDYIKPCCHIVLPSCVRDHNDFVVRYAKILDDLRRDYNFNPSEQIVVDILNPAQTGPEFPEDQLARDIRGTLRDDINDFYYSTEQDHLGIQETLMVHRCKRFITDKTPTEMIKLLGKYS